jgi:DNA-binding MarR family transcriptional regulator
VNRRDLERALLDAVRRAQSAVDRTDELAAQLLGINRTDLRCLDILERFGTRSAGELSDELLVTTGAVTALIDRLERAGYIRRVADPNDRRRVLVELEPRARTKLHDIYAPLAVGGQEILLRLSKADLDIVIAFLREETELNRRVAEQLRLQLDATAGIPRMKQTLKDTARQMKTPAKELKATMKHEIKRRTRPKSAD